MARTARSVDPTEVYDRIVAEDARYTNWTRLRTITDVASAVTGKNYSGDGFGRSAISYAAEDISVASLRRAVADLVEQGALVALVGADAVREAGFPGRGIGPKVTVYVTRPVYDAQIAKRDERQLAARHESLRTEAAAQVFAEADVAARVRAAYERLCAADGLDPITEEG